MLSKLFPSKEKSVFTLLLFIAIISSCFAQTKTYEIDVEKSEIKFSIKHLGVLTVNGLFTDFSGTLILDSEGILKTINSQISVKSINTGNKERDESVISDAYLNHIEFPNINFNSIRFTKDGDTNLLIGNLRIKGIEKEVSIPVTFITSKNIQLKTSLRRSDFKLSFGAMDSLIGNTIKIELNIYGK